MAHGVFGAGPKMFWVHFSQFKEFGENRGLLPLSILDFTNLCADRGLEVGLADLLCPIGGGGVRTHPTHPPAYGPEVIRGIKFNIAECFLHCLISSGLQCPKILLTRLHKSRSSLSELEWARSKIKMQDN